MVEEAKVTITFDRDQAERELSEIERKGIRRRKGILQREREDSDKKTGKGLFSGARDFFKRPTNAVTSRFKTLGKVAAIGGGAILIAEFFRTAGPLVEGLVFETLKKIFPKQAIEPLETVVRTVVDDILIESIQRIRAPLQAGFAALGETKTAITGLAAANRIPRPDETFDLFTQFYKVHLADVRNNLELQEALTGQIGANLLTGLAQSLFGTDQATKDGDILNKARGEFEKAASKGGR